MLQETEAAEAAGARQGGCTSEPSVPEAAHDGAEAEIVNTNVANPTVKQLRCNTEQIAPGLVVWGTVKGWPPWPAIVLTQEEMDVAGVIGQRGNLLKGVLKLI